MDHRHNAEVNDYTCNIHHYPRPPHHHVEQNRMKGAEHALEICVLHGIPLLLGHAQKGLPRIDSGVIDQDIDPARTLRRAIDPALHIARVADVSAGSDCRTPCGAYRLRDALASVDVPIQDMDMRALAGEESRHSFTNAGGAA